jgi:hypothetical protein
MRDALEREGAPADLLQCLRSPEVGEAQVL